MQQATLKAVGWERRYGEGEERREPCGIRPLHGYVGREADALWPLAKGAIEVGTRFTQVELHLHWEGWLPVVPRPDVPFEVERLTAHSTLAGKVQA